MTNEAHRTTEEMLQAVRDYALGPGPAAGGETILRWQGEFRLRRGWQPFRAEERLDGRRLEFNWEARLKLGPLLNISVRDAFLGGKGALRCRVLGMTVVSATPGPDLDAAEGLRFLVEMPWCPFAYENPLLEWVRVEDEGLRVSGERAGSRVDLTFRVDDEGRVLSCEAIRPRQVEKRFEPTEWQGQYLSAASTRD